MSLTKTELRLERWRDQLKNALDKNNTKIMPDSCRWYLYWLGKISREIPEIYPIYYSKAEPILVKVANALNMENRKQLEEAAKHRIDTKVRLKALISYVYQYQKYIHPLFIETQSISSAQEEVRSFVDSYLIDI
jgi:hypothetical protein